VNSSYDVIVVGAGCAGSTAAITAARAGARTLLIERLPFAGGTSTAVLDTIYAFYTPGPNPSRVVGGLAWEVVERLVAEGVAFERPNTYGAGTGVTYDPEVLKLVWEDLLVAAGAELLLHSVVVGADVVDGRIRGVRVWNKAGEATFEAAVVIDASGDADVCALIGVAYDDIRTTPNLQSLSTLFRLANVDVEHASAVPKEELWERMRAASESGAYRLPRIEGSWHRTPYEGVVQVHMTRITGVDPTDPVAMTRAELDGRRQVREYARFLQDREPGFERSIVVATSPAIGVRESRRVHGDYILTRADVLEAHRFEDEIVLCGAPIEDHHAGRDTSWQYVPRGGVYGVPYRTLLPAGIEGVIVAGRCFSSTHDAHASARSMATCMAMGEAAGTAGAMAASADRTPREINPDFLRSKLRDQGAILEVPAPIPMTSR
jgi:hypothetical protein